MWTSNTNQACPLEAYEEPSCCRRITIAAAPKGWHSPPLQLPRHSVIAHEALGPGVPNDGCQCASPQVGHMG